VVWVSAVGALGIEPWQHIAASGACLKSIGIPRSFDRIIQRLEHIVLIPPVTPHAILCPTATPSNRLYTATPRTGWAYYYLIGESG
jgi:hypothetical protein